MFGLRLALAAAVLLPLGGCSSWVPKQTSESFLGFITPYRMDIVQGNVVTKEQVAVIKPGMTRTQVRDILGSPMLTDLFHTDRWDYVFTIVRQGTEPQRRSVVAWFKGDRLDHLDAADEGDSATPVQHRLSARDATATYLRIATERLC